MNLQIRDPRAYELAKKLAEKKKVTMTEAVIRALEGELAKDAGAEKPVWERLQPLLERVRAERQPGGHVMTKDEIDAMWGHD